MHIQKNRMGMGLFCFLLLIQPLSFASESSGNLSSLVKSNTSFAIDLYGVLKEGEGNLFFSPYSISTALAMTYGGARENTAKEMENVLYFRKADDKTHTAFSELRKRLNGIQQKGDIQLHIANSIWPQNDYPFLQKYICLLKQQYGVSVKSLDYAAAAEEARKTINQWVESQTEEKIKDLIRRGDLDPQTVLLLVNAIYFKGNWDSLFEPNRTAVSDFNLIDGNKTQAPMMTQKGPFGYRDIDEIKVLELPYVGRQLSMIILLPNQPNDIFALENRLSSNALKSWISQLPEKDVMVFLPKFKITWGTSELNDFLRTLGMKNAFSSSADFSGMDGTKNLYIDRVLHKAFVEVNEEGTEAAAATAVSTKKSIPRIYTFRADHPFLFLIRDNTTESILFFGRLLDPNPAS